MNSTITPEQFALLCYNILMNGAVGKAINYQAEKISMITEGYEAFGRLDWRNQKKVLDYLDYWHIDLPKIVKNNLEETARILKS